MSLNIGKDMPMAEKIIRKKRRRFKHLRREEVAEVVTAMDRTEGRTLEKVKGIARKAGCSVATCYRLYGESRIEALGPSGQRREERHVSAVLTPRETFRKRNSSGNARKAEKAAGFLRLVSDYVREDRMLRTLEEAWHAIRGAGYSGPSVCVKTLYSYCREGLLDGIRPVDLPRRKAWKTRQKWKTYTDRKARGTPVSERPEEIGSRKTFGHWKGGLVVGPKGGIRGAYLTLVERRTRFLVRIPVRSKKASDVLSALVSYKACHPSFGRRFRSVTFDNGSEFSLWKERERLLSVKTYFGRPYRSGDRGSNENCNGLIRRYVKKGTDIGKIGRNETERINRKINAKPRGILGWESAASSFESMLSKEGIPVEDMYLLE